MPAPKKYDEMNGEKFMHEVFEWMTKNDASANISKQKISKQISENSDIGF